MTQTLMDFLKLVAPAGSTEGAAQSSTAAQVDRLDAAEARMTARLKRLNRQVANMCDHGRLVAIPLCPSACEPGVLSDFIFSLGTDPFRRWNMMIYADSAATAQLLDTLPYHPDYTSDTDAVMVDYLTGLIATRDAYFKAKPDLTHADLDTYRGTLCTRLITDCREIETALFGARKRLWQVHGVDGTSKGAPPKAAINPAISSGNGAEYRI